MADTAFLILAHEHPEMLARLVQRLKHPSATVFVHVDGKSDLDQFKAAIPEGVFFLEKQMRVESHWGAFSVIRATLNLIRTAVLTAPSTERFVLISGVDYPVLPIERILELLGKDIEFIQVDRALDPKGRGEFDRCANRMFLGENRLFNPRTGPRFLGLVRAAVARMPRMPGYGATIYYGPPHWALTRAAIEIIVNTEKCAPEKIQWFRYSLYPDEMVFQTILKNSSRADYISYDGSKTTPTWHSRLAGIGYIDWDNPNPYKPRTLDLRDLEEIRASGALFARKVHLHKSAELLDALDAAVDADKSTY